MEGKGVEGRDKGMKQGLGKVRKEEGKGLWEGGDYCIGSSACAYGREVRRSNRLNISVAVEMARKSVYSSREGGLCTDNGVGSLDIGWW